MSEYIERKIVINDIDEFIKILQKPPMGKIDKKLVETLELWKIRILNIDTLEKQIPKKGSIKYLSSYTDDPPVLLCPHCQEHIPTEGCNFYKYCYKCGQALDWSDTNDR